MTAWPFWKKKKLPYKSVWWKFPKRCAKQGLTTELWNPTKLRPYLWREKHGFPLSGRAVTFASVEGNTPNIKHPKWYTAALNNLLEPHEVLPASWTPYRKAQHEPSVTFLTLLFSSQQLLPLSQHFTTSGFHMGMSLYGYYYLSQDTQVVYYFFGHISARESTILTAIYKEKDKENGLNGEDEKDMCPKERDDDSQSCPQIRWRWSGHKERTLLCTDGSGSCGLHTCEHTWRRV